MAHRPEGGRLRPTLARSALLFAAALLPALLPWLAPPAARAATYIIRPDGSGDFPTIQAGIDGTTGADILLLADGVFSGPGNRDLSIAHTVQIHGQSGSPDLCAIELAAEPLGTLGAAGATFREIDFRHGDGIDGMLTGVGFVGCRFTAPLRVGWIQEGLLELTDCEILGASGGAYSLGGAETLRLLRCEVIGFEGTRLFSAFDLSATDCRFEENLLSGALLLAVPWMSMSPSLAATRCAFQDNAAAGGMLAATDGYLTAEQCTFSGNQGPSLQASVAWTEQDVLLQATGCTMADNLGPAEIAITRDPGAGVPTLHLDRAILARRSGGCAVSCTGEGIATELSCCDIFGNDGGDWTGCIAGHFGADGNIAEDPLFCGGGYGYLLQDLSPCAPGATCAETIGAWPVGCPSAGVSEAGTITHPLVALNPNPFAGQICFRATMAEEAAGLSIELFDAAGRLVRAFGGDGSVQSAWVWDGSLASGEPAPAGVYLFRARSGSRAQRGHVILAR